MQRPKVEKVVTMVGLTSDNSQSNKGTPYLAELDVKLHKTPEGTEAVSYTHLQSMVFL